MNVKYKKMWNELKEQINSVFDKNETHFLEDATYADVLSMMEQLEKEFKRKEDFIHSLHNDMFNKGLEKEND